MRTQAIREAVSGGEFERAATSLPATLTAAQQQLFRDGHWGQGVGVFQVAVPFGSPNSYAARVYVGDSFANWGGIQLKNEGNTTAVNVDTNAYPFWSYLLPNGSDAIVVTTVRLSVIMPPA